MPKKEKQPSRDIDRTKTTNLSQNKTNHTRTPFLIFTTLAVFGVIGGFIANLVAREIPRVKPSSDDLLDDCIQLPRKNSHNSLCDSSTSLSHCSVEYLEKIPKHELPHPLTRVSDDDSFNNTPLHFSIANLSYKKVEWLIKTFSKLNKEMFKAKDRNGCTPLVLAGKIGSPSNVIRRFINEDTAVMADNQGITPLMLAARGQDPKIIQILLDAIGKDRIEEELNRKDSKGRTVADWGKMNLQEMYDDFFKLEVDPQKAANHCFNTLSVETDHQTIIQGNVTQEVAERGFEIGPNFFQGVAYRAFTASKTNVKKLLEIATDKGPSANEVRQELAELFQPKIAHDAHKVAKFWKGVAKETGDLIHKISDDRLLHVYRWNQDINGRLINDYAGTSGTAKRFV